MMVKALKFIINGRSRHSQVFFTLLGRAMLNWIICDQSNGDLTDVETGEARQTRQS